MQLSDCTMSFIHDFFFYCINDQNVLCSPKILTENQADKYKMQSKNKTNYHYSLEINILKEGINK